MDLVATASSYGKETVTLITDLSIATTVAIATTAVLFVFALKFGKDRIVALILALYAGLLLFVNFPYVETFQSLGGGEANTALSNTAVFIVFVVVSYLVLGRVVWTEYPRGPRRFVEALLLSLSAAALLLAFAYHMLPIASAYPFTPSFDRLFEPSKFFFWWLVFPLIIVFFFSRK